MKKFINSLKILGFVLTLLTGVSCLYGMFEDSDSDFGVLRRTGTQTFDFEASFTESEAPKSPRTNSSQGLSQSNTPSEASIEAEATQYHMPTYFKAIYQHPNNLPVFKKPWEPKPYTPSVIPHEEFIKTIEQVTALNTKTNPTAWLNGTLPDNYSTGDTAYAGPLAGVYVQRKFFPVGTQFVFIGDLHGDIHALIRQLEELMHKGYLDEHLNVINSNIQIVFLGDMVDYGNYGIDTLFTALQLRLRNPDNVILCRGNHEQDQVYARDFINEYRERYKVEHAQAMTFGKDYMGKLCSTLPIALFIGIEGKPEQGYALCCHGGIDESAKEFLKEFFASNAEFAALPIATCSQGGMSGFNWADFSGKETLSNESSGNHERYPRNGGNAHAHCKVYTLQETKEFMDETNIRIVFRGHQDAISSSKIVIPGIHYPIYPFLNRDGFSILSPEGQKWQSQDIINKYYSTEELAHLKNLKAQFMRVFKGAYELYAQGFEVQHFLDTIAPVFVATFSNARTPKILEDEGFGLVTLGNSWQTSNVRLRVEQDIKRSRFELKPEIIAIAFNLLAKKPAGSWSARLNPFIYDTESFKELLTTPIYLGDINGMTLLQHTVKTSNKQAINFFTSMIEFHKLQGFVKELNGIKITQGAE